MPSSWAPCRVRRLLLCGLSGLMLFAGCNCEFRYVYQLRGVVKSVADGRPLGGVNVELRAEDSRGEFPLVTRSDGYFTARFYVGESQFGEGLPHQLPTWSLVLTRDGYDDEVIDISPVKRPVARKHDTELFVVAHMRPVP